MERHLLQGIENCKIFVNNKYMPFYIKKILAFYKKEKIRKLSPLKFSDDSSRRNKLKIEMFCQMVSRSLSHGI